MTEPKLPAEPTPLTAEDIKHIPACTSGCLTYDDNYDVCVGTDHCAIAQLKDQALAAIALRSELTSAIARAAKAERNLKSS